MAAEHGPCDVLFLDSVPSTNSYLMNRSEVLTAFESVASVEQFRGRGRLGREWASSGGLGLALSVAVPANHDHGGIGPYPLLAGGSVLDTIRQLGLPEADLKWPNDILVSDRKLAGILCEVPSPSFVVVGIGVNLYHSDNELPVSVATSLRIEGVHVEDWKSFACLIVERLREDWQEIPNVISQWDSYWERRLGTIGRSVTVTEHDGSSWDGLAMGVDERGCLLVKPSNGQSLRSVLAGDVHHLRH